MATLERMVFCHGSRDTRHPKVVTAREIHRLIATQPGDSFHDLMLFLRIRNDAGTHFFDLKGNLGDEKPADMASFVHRWDEDGVDVLIVKIRTFRVSEPGEFTFHLFDESGAELGTTGLHIE